jgi:hypothetical protein
MSVDSELLEKIEGVINGFGAELTAQKVILELLIAHMLVIKPMLAEETLEELKLDVIAALKRPPRQPTPDDDKRVVELAVQHGEKFFQNLAESVSKMRTRLGQVRH